MAYEKERQILVQADKNRVQVDPLSSIVPGGLTLEAAHAICEANIQARIDGGDRLRGYKVGYPNPVVRQALGVPDANYGYVLQSMVLEQAGAFNMKELIGPRIECEIAFVLKAPLSGPGLTVEDVLAASEGICAAFEIADAHFKDWKCPYPDTFADNSFCARVVLSERLVPATEFDLTRETAVIYRDGVELGRGLSDTIMGHPARSVAWLAGKLAERGRSLRAGDFILTGSVTPIYDMKAPATYRGTFAHLGVVEKRFV